MKVAARSDTGKLRKINEDSYLVDKDNGLFAVADGMGGHRAGEVASSLALKTFASSYLKQKKSRLKLEKRISAAVDDANKAVYSAGMHESEHTGMGTTLVVALIHDKDLLIANVGDSRIYLIHKDEITRLTKDHTLLYEMIARGEVEAAIARFHPLRNIITRAIGTHEEVETDIKEHRLQKNELFLICSDGLTSMLEDKEILAIIRDSTSLESASKELVDQANKAGGEDNITVVLFQP